MTTGIVLVTRPVIDATHVGMRTRRLVWITGIAFILLAGVTVLSAVGALVPDILGDPAERAAFGIVALFGLAGVVGTLVEIVRLREAAEDR
ncbi:hypothetical protein QRX60_35450 [Amycolatopsis mongoliensis]|uniref:Uncharacterized protein n=1 Tax=Amycolatopsis mongoliensis TaxID=715475 RepID=A0A9Y2JJR4_9PSEU|nr:hypothetical protein [Amycolatopsis sp. 4-36]WIX99317.1 hypothetical protein QRX60_35450 [Amycolatopsis sp. 4-36]